MSDRHMPPQPDFANFDPYFLGYNFAQGRTVDLEILVAMVEDPTKRGFVLQGINIATQMKIQEERVRENE